MKYGEVIKSVAGLLRGDNSKAEEVLTTDDVYLSMAIRDISMRCAPRVLTGLWDDTKTDVFRRVHSELNEEEYVYNSYYIRKPLISLDKDSEIDMDEELSQAVIFFMCSYLSNKKNEDYVKRAEVTISFYDSNSVDLSQYEF